MLLSHRLEIAAGAYGSVASLRSTCQAEARLGHHSMTRSQANEPVELSIVNSHSVHQCTHVVGQGLPTGLPLHFNGDEMSVQKLGNDFWTWWVTQRFQFHLKVHHRTAQHSTGTWELPIRSFQVVVAVKQRGMPLPFPASSH
jgi:hypothetical protein